MPGRQSRDPLSKVLRRGLELRNTHVTHLVELNATLCHATNTSDQWSMVSVVGNANFKRALQLQTEFFNLLLRNSSVPST